jgi:hypothetical protein
LTILALLIILTVVGVTMAKPVWSICDESANPGCADAAKSQGYWNFQYDDAAPYTTAGLYCCWWERWHKWQRFGTFQGQSNTMNLGTSDSSSLSTAAKSGSTSGTSSADASVETKSYCPSCCGNCDDEDMSAVQAKAEAIMAKKPWLTEGKTKAPVSQNSVSDDLPSAPVLMNFSAAS